MQHIRLEISLPPTMDADVERWAIEEDVSVGQIVRELIRKEQRRRATPKTTQRADEALVARLQRLLVPAMADAFDWDDLHKRLAALSHALKPAGGGLTVHDLTTGARLCKSSELGFPYARFVRKFRCPMPGLPQKMAHVLGKLRAQPNADAEDFDVVERFTLS